ncbi:MAG TPA: ATP-grasp domain-containing protein, partial [Kofleriaceae bacterium]|nr:ATP-grasp domain-containing protein [Kofleriaceae bacterium]
MIDAARLILVDEGWSSTLHLARALVTAGARVEVVTANGKHHPAFERRGVTWRSGPRLGDPALGELLRGATVIPMTEAALLADLPNAFPVLAPGQRALIADKHAMVAHAGVPYPATIAIDATFDLDAAIARLGLPVVIRGAVGNCGSHTHICDTRQRAAEVLATIRGTWVAQEFIASPTFLVGGVFERGRPIRIYAGEKVEQWPPRVGPAVRMRARRDPELVAAGLRAFERLQWTGFASADFVRGRDGYQLLEINPRLWGSIAAAMVAGVDMFEPFFQLVTGRSPAPDLEFIDGVECRIFPRNLA